MCGYFCIRFINFMFQCKALTDFSNLSAPNKSKIHNLKVFYY